MSNYDEQAHKVAAMDAELSQAIRDKFINIQFQEGPIRDVGINGCQVEDVIVVLVDRLRELNVPPYNSRETSLAITALEEAGLWLLKRTLDRRARGVEGTSQP